MPASFEALSTCSQSLPAIELLAAREDLERFAVQLVSLLRRHPEARSFDLQIASKQDLQSVTEGVEGTKVRITVSHSS